MEVDILTEIEELIEDLRGIENTASALCCNTKEDSDPNVTLLQAQWNLERNLLAAFKSLKPSLNKCVQALEKIIEFNKTHQIPTTVVEDSPTTEDEVTSEVNYDEVLKAGKKRSSPQLTKEVKVKKSKQPKNVSQGIRRQVDGLPVRGEGLRDRMKNVMIKVGWVLLKKGTKHVADQLKTSNIPIAKVTGTVLDVTGESVGNVMQQKRVALHENSPLLISVNVLKCFSSHFTYIYGP